MLIFRDTLPDLKAFLKPAPLSPAAQGLLIRCLVAFLMHLGQMSASHAAGALRAEPRHRAQVTRSLARKYWGRTNLLNPLRGHLLALAAQHGTSVFAVDQTSCGQQGRTTEDTSSRGNYRPRPEESRRRQQTTARRSCHCFVMGLLITPGGIRVPPWRPYYTADDCKAHRIDSRTQTELAAALIAELPLPEDARVVVVGDTAFEAQSIRTACAERGYTWIVPMNPERVLAGEKPRPKVSSPAEELTADQLVRLEVHPGRGRYVAQRRIARCRLGPRLKARTYYVHQEGRDVHSVGGVRWAFSTTKAPAKGRPVDVQEILRTNDEALSLRDVIELYQLRWQIELFFKELKSTLGLHHYRFRRFAQVEAWVTLTLVTFVYWEWIRARELRPASLPKGQRSWWQAQRTYGLARAVRQAAEQKEMAHLARSLETPGGLQRLRKQLSQAHPREYRAVGRMKQSETRNFKTGASG